MLKKSPPKKKKKKLLGNQTDKILILDIKQIWATETSLRFSENEPYYSFTIDATLPADNAMRFRKKYFDSPL